MGANLSFQSGKFYFNCTSKLVHDLARRARFIQDRETLRWTTRNPRKAVLLRRFADKSAEQKFKNYFITEFDPPEELIYPEELTPRPFQLESAWHCVTRSPAYNADEAGLGKTITSIICMNSVPGRTLIICPPFLKYNWFNEINRWGARPGNNVSIIESGDSEEHLFRGRVVIMPDSLLINERIRTLLYGEKFEWCFIDEAHRYKEASTKRTQSLAGREDDADWFAIATCARRIVFLSGTPIPNGRPIELYPLLSSLSFEAIGFRSKAEYGRLFCAGREVTRFEGKRAIRNWDFTGASNLKRLRRELREKLMIRHLKKDVLSELPPKTRQIIFLDAPTSIQPLEKKLLKNFTLDELMGEDHELGDIATYRREVGNAKMLPSFNYIHELLENGKDKLVVFAYHVDVVEALNRMLSDFGSLMIRGGMTSKEKQKKVTLFQTKDEHRVIIGNIDAMGVGNTLTKAPAVIVVEPSWVPGINEQAEDRVHRMTQERNVYIKYLVLRGSLDERMLHRVLEKQRNIDEAIG